MADESGTMSIRAASCIDPTLVPASHRGGCGFCNGFGNTVTGLPEFEDHSTPMVGPHGKSQRYTRVVRRVYLGGSEGCGRAVDRQDTRRGLHSELFEVGRHLRRQARALN